MRRLACAAIAALMTTAFPASHAGAGKRLHWFALQGPESYYPGPEFVPPPRYYPYYRYLVPGAGMTPEEFEAAYGRGLDENYYEPEYQPAPPTRKKSQATTARPATGERAATSSASGALTCAKAGSIVSSYGFTGVKSTVCTGKVYAFNGTRDGKTYAIKLNAASGELTEVRKVQ